MSRDKEMVVDPHSMIGGTIGDRFKARAGVDLHPADRKRRQPELALDRLGNALAQLDAVAGGLALPYDERERPRIRAIGNPQRRGLLDGLQPSFDRLSASDAAGQRDAQQRNDHAPHETLSWELSPKSPRAQAMTT